MTFDFLLEQLNLNLVVLKPQTPEAQAWIDKCVEPDSPRWMGGVTFGPSQLTEIELSLELHGLTLGWA